MTDTYRGMDLTDIVDKVAQVRYERDREALMASQTAVAWQEFPPTWDELEPLQRHSIKNQMAQFVTDVINALPDVGEPFPNPETLYDVARRVTDDALGKGTYASLNAAHPDPGVQAAIARYHEESA